MEGKTFMPAGSPVLRVHGEKLVGLTYGPLALAMMAADPVSFAAFFANSSTSQGRYGRLASTAIAWERIVLGAPMESRAVAGRVRGAHAATKAIVFQGKVHRVDDADHLLWITACLGWSALQMYRLWVGPLDAREADRFWADYLRGGRLVGLPASFGPQTYGELRIYVARMIERASVGDDAWHFGRRMIRELPLPPRHRMLVRLVRSAVILASVRAMPARMRRLYGVAPLTRFDRLRLEVLRRAVRLARRWDSPRWRGPVAPVYRAVERALRQLEDGSD